MSNRVKELNPTFYRRGGRSWSEGPGRGGDLFIGEAAPHLPGSLALRWRCLRPLSSRLWWRQVQASGGGKVGHGDSWWLRWWPGSYSMQRGDYCGLMSHKQQVTTNLFNLHFDFVTCHKQLLHHAYWVTLWAVSLENILILKIQWTSRDKNIDMLFVGCS